MSKNTADLRLLISNSLESSMKFRCEGDPATAETVEIDLYGIIDDFDWGDDNGMTAKNLADELKKYPAAKNIIININSPGGSCFAAAAMTNILARNAAKKIVNIDGAALSAASVVAMSGDEINMAENALMMIHNPWTCTCGDAEELHKEAEAIDKIKGTIVATYAARTGQKSEDIAAWMDGETWFTADEAKAKGFATSISPAKKVAAMAGNLAAIRAMNYRRIPESITALDGSAETNGTPGGAQPPANATKENQIMAEETKPAGQGTEEAPPATEEAPKPAETGEGETPAAGEGETPANPQNEGQKFLNAFGDKGGKWFAEGKTFDEARDLNAADMKAENKALTEQVAALNVKLGASQAAAGSEEGAEAVPADEDGKPKCLKDVIRVR